MVNSPRPKGRLVMLRHGETTWNTQRVIQGHADDSVLTERGQEHVREVVDTLRALEVDYLISSDLGRALETARIIAEALKLEIVKDPALRERNFGVLEGGPLAAAVPTLVGIEGEWVTDPTARPEGGESLEELYFRTSTVIDRVANELSRRRVLLVTHGGAIRTMRAYCEGASMQGRRWDVVDNCSIWSVELPGTQGGKSPPAFRG